MTIGWRPHDLPTAYIPFTHGIGVEVGRSDPVFMGRLGKTPVPNNQAPYPYVPKDVDDRFRAQDPTAQEEVQIGVAWLQEANSGLFRTWEDLKFLRDNWEGPLILKGIQSVQVLLNIPLLWRASDSFLGRREILGPRCRRIHRL